MPLRHGFLIRLLSMFGIILQCFLVEAAETDSPSGWPSIRGSQFDGRVRGEELADHWPTTGPPVLWVRPLGQGYSSFIAHGDRVFTQTQSLAGQSVVCLEAETGRTVWEYRYDWPFEASGLYPGPRATPSYDAGRIYFAAPSGLIGALSEDRGKLIWSVNLKEKFDGKGTDFGYSASPTLVDGKVFLPVGGHGSSVVALDGRTGKILWKSGDASASYTPLLPIEMRGQRALIALMENTLSAYDLQSGTEFWSIDLSQGYDEHAAWPIFSEPYLLICSPFKSGATLYDLGSDIRRPPKEVRRTRQMSNDIFSSLLIGDVLYGFDLLDVQAKLHRPSRGTFRCLEFPSLKQRWETVQTGHSTVLEANGKLILFNDKGELILAKADPEAYVELGRTELLTGEICWTQPTLHNGRLYVRNQTQAACLYLGRPEKLPRTDRQSKLLSITDIPHGRYFDFAAILGIEPEYAFDVPDSDWINAWYFYSLIATLLPAAILTLFVRRVWPPTGIISRWRFYWIVAFILGIVGTTCLSLLRGAFTFTWPVCIFCGLQSVIFHSHWGALKQVRHPRIVSYSMATLFLAICVGYFLICRRLSLVTEWVFLIGMLGGVPFAILGARDSLKPAGSFRAILWTGLAFSAYYWSCVLVLNLRYA